MINVYYEVTFRRNSGSTYTTMSVLCHGEYEAIAKIKAQYPEAIIISVRKK